MLDVKCLMDVACGLLYMHIAGPPGAVDGRPHGILLVMAMIIFTPENTTCLSVPTFLSCILAIGGAMLLYLLDMSQLKSASLRYYWKCPNLEWTWDMGSKH